ncbi:MAG: ComEC/Rec2 family competence protein [Polyangiaceae bacterium]|nr:ComEC/Rec2 family competence protein [Polyangiaceae bacterium]
MGTSRLWVDPLLLVAIAGALGSLTVTAPLAATITAGLAACWLGRRTSTVVLVLGLLCFVVTAWRAQSRVDDFQDSWMAVREILGEPRRCAARATILRSPVLRGGSMVLQASLTDIDCEGRVLPDGLRARLYGGSPDLHRGDVLDIVAQLGPLRLFRNVDLLSPMPGAARRAAALSGGMLSATVLSRGTSFRSSIDRARHHVRRRIQKTFSPPAIPLARALVLGEEDLDPSDAEAFRKSGLAHLLAVSGTHLVFAVVALVTALNALLVRIEFLASRVLVLQLTAPFGAALALLYADFAGGSGSAWRAAWMLAFGYGLRALGREARPGHCLGASIALGLIVDPLLGFDISFALSMAATIGLVVVGRPLAARCAGIENPSLKFLSTAAIATVSSMLLCAPLLAVMSTDLTLVGVVANVIAGPFGEVVALPLCLLHMGLQWCPSLERGVALVASGALVVVGQLAEQCASYDFANIPVPAPSRWHLSLLFLGGLLQLLPSLGCARGTGLVRTTGQVGGLGRVREAARVCPPRMFRSVAAAVTCLALLGVEQTQRSYGRGVPGQLRISVLDIGQGDSTLIDLPDGRLMLIDGGGFVGSPVDPGKSVLLPVLRARRRRRVDIVVLSHPHPDHFTGLASAVPKIEVGEFWDTGQGAAEGAGPIYASLLAGLRARAVPIRGPAELCGNSQLGGGITVLGPCPGFEPHINANDNSFVLQLTDGTQRALLTGDAEAEQEAELLKRYGSGLRSTFLKVGHHGSRTSTSPEFLAAVAPTLATVSSGVRNRYGHPHPNTLATLEAGRVSVLRTDQLGGIAWSSAERTTHVASWAGL